MNKIDAPPAKSIILNSRPKKAFPGVWYKADIRVISQDIGQWTSYVSLIWLRTFQDEFRELGRVVKWLKSGDQKYTLLGRAPKGATHVVLGVRVYCEGAHTYARKTHLEVQELQQCEPRAIPKLSVPFLRLLSRSKRLRSTVDLNIEMVSYCNLRCIWCSLDHAKPKRIMDPELLELVLKQVRASNIVTRRIDLHNGGEALLHPAFCDMMRILGSARSLGDFPYTALLTNGTTLDYVKCEAILKHNAVDLVRFSVDGGTSEEFERIRKGTTFKRINDNIRRFVAMNDKAGHAIVTGIICIVDEKYPLTTEWMSDEFKELLSLVDSVELRRPHNWDGSVDLEFQVQPNENGLCYFMKNNNLVVLPNGDVTVCCADLNSRGVIGNVRNESLADILNCEKRKEMIGLMKRRRRREIRLCANCSQPSVFE